ncbi:UDP-glycosyltransferase 72B1-like [Panicum virgatum]|uniref:UDP-glycosyltransferase 72B1-like n=1 Tax=Panicum virgatum TaxID=38727 RepID=UPI0019D5A1ED|nr:UDP-glycosyltransferase 72B1-like [Panicum virgatum]
MRLLNDLHHGSSSVQVWYCGISSSAAFRSIQQVPEDPVAWLPEGFLDRTSLRGLVVASWAPQVRVLSHPATAVFVSHCGWNSTLESVASGVPMVAWPLHTEQRTNAAVLSESVGVALRPRAARAVRELMEGEKGRAVRRRTGDLRQAADAAWV